VADQGHACQAALCARDEGPKHSASRENRQHPSSGDRIRTFTIATTDANELPAPIHNRMPVILAPAEYDRWLSTAEPDPRDLLRPFAAEPMMMWPISTRVNSPANDDASIMQPVKEICSPSPDTRSRNR
jgi:putative SOS response-associated peptidase YedK